MHDDLKSLQIKDAFSKYEVWFIKLNPSNWSILNMKVDHDLDALDKCLLWICYEIMI